MNQKCLRTTSRTFRAALWLALLLLAPAACTPPPTTGNQNQNASNTNVNANTSQNDNSAPSAPVWREALDTTNLGFMSAVWGSAPTDVFAVGGQIGQGEVWHFDGQTWSRMRIPTVSILVWVYGFGPDDVFAVGQNGGIIHYNGQSWRLQDATTTSNDFWGVWGATPNDVWTVGGRVNTGPIIILHYDGTSWTEVPAPPLDRASTSLFKIWGTSADHIFAVGHMGVIIEYDGANWFQVESGTTEDLISLWGSAPNRISAIGGRVTGVISQYDGSAWTTRSLAPLLGLNGVFVDSPNEAIAVGLLGTAASIDLNTFAFTLEPTPTPLTLHAVWGDGRGKTYAVGGAVNQLPYLGTILVRTVE